jgi:hypothetical protein
VNTLPTPPKRACNVWDKCPTSFSSLGHALVLWWESARNNQEARSVEAEKPAPKDGRLYGAGGASSATGYWDSPARADTLTLRGPSFFHSILLEVRGTPVAQR